MRGFLALVRKDWRLEFRGLEMFSVMIMLSLLMAATLGAGVQSALIDDRTVAKLFPSLLWFVFIVTAAVSVGRSFEYEVNKGAMEGALLTGVSPITIYFSKWISSTGVVLLAQLVSMAALSVLLNVSLLSHLIELTFLSVLVVGGYTALSTLIAAMASTSKLKGLLLPLILLPLLFPLFFAAIELTTDILTLGSIDISSVWLSLLIGVDLVYLVLGICLFEYVIKDR